MQNASEHGVLARNHVADGEGGKTHVGLKAAVGGRGRNAIAKGVHGNDVVLRGVHELAGAEEFNQVFGGAGEPGGEKNDVGLIAIELTEGAVAQTAVANNLSIFQLEIAERGEF